MNPKQTNKDLTLYILRILKKSIQPNTPIPKVKDLTEYKVYIIFKAQET